MRTVYKITALILLVTWLAVTKHAVLEMAGWIPDHHAVSASDPESKPMPKRPAVPGAAQSGWDLADKSVPKPATPTSKIAMPPLTLLAVAFVFLRISYREPMLSSVAKIAFERPYAWVPRWHFERRAAPISRAPSWAFAA